MTCVPGIQWTRSGHTKWELLWCPSVSCMRRLDFMATRKGDRWTYDGATMRKRLGKVVFGAKVKKGYLTKNYCSNRIYAESFDGI